MFSYLLRLDKFPCRFNFFEKDIRENNYPENFIDKCFKKFLDDIHLVKKKYQKWKESVCS